MTTLRVAAMVGFGAAALVDIYAYEAVAPLRGVISHQHWIIFVYLSAEAWVVSGAMVFAVSYVSREALRWFGDLVRCGRPDRPSSLWEARK